MKKIVVILFILITVIVKSQSLIWTDFKNLNDSLRTERKPLLVFVYTDWCKFCKMQEETTFKDTAIIKKLNTHFYCLKLNAEEKNSIHFFNKTYYPKASGYHQLAEYLCIEKGEITFPTTIFFNKEFLLEKRHFGLLDKTKLVN